MSLIKLVREGNYVAISEMIKNCDATERVGKILMNDSRGWTSLHHASSFGNLDILKLLLSTMSGRDALEAVSRLTFTGETCLFLACLSDAVGALDVVHYLLSLGANPNPTEEQEKIPLLAACSKKGNLDMVKMLVTMGADLRAEVAEYRYTPLDAALFRKDIDVVNYLLNHHKRLKATVPFWCYTFALNNIPEMVPSVLNMMDVEDIRKFLCNPHATRACRISNKAITIVKPEMTDFDYLIVSQKLEETFASHLSHADSNPNPILLKAGYVIDIKQDDLPEYEEPSEYCQSLDDFAAVCCLAVSAAKINLCVDDPKELLCEGELLKYFPELDVRQKISLKAKARHIYRCELNKKYTSWRAYNWLKKDFNCPGLKGYLLYEDVQPKTFIRKEDRI